VARNNFFLKVLGYGVEMGGGRAFVICLYSYTLFFHS
jgi:hypothetical protein